MKEKQEADITAPKTVKVMFLKEIGKLRKLNLIFE